MTWALETSAVAASASVIERSALLKESGELDHQVAHAAHSTPGPAPACTHPNTTLIAGSLQASQCSGTGCLERADARSTT